MKRETNYFRKVLVMKFFVCALTTILLFITLTVLPMKRGWKRTEKPVEQELMYVKKIRALVLPQINHLKEVFANTSLKESELIVPFGDAVQKVELAKCILQKNPKDEELNNAVTSLIQQVVAFSINSHGVAPCEKNSQDLQVYDSDLDPFPIECADFPENLLRKSGYIKKQLDYFVDILKNFYEENNRGVCKKIVSPSHLALVVRGARKLLQCELQDVGTLASLDMLIDYAKKNMVCMNEEAGIEHVKNVMAACSHGKNIKVEVKLKIRGIEVFTYDICEMCLRRTRSLSKEYKKLWPGIKVFNAELKNGKQICT